MHKMEDLKRTVFCCVWFLVEANATIFAIFHISGFFFATSYFSCIRDPGVVKIVPHIPKSLFYRDL